VWDSLIPESEIAAAQPRKITSSSSEFSELTVGALGWSSRTVA
jgi:hypothetical protein